MATQGNDMVRRIPHIFLFGLAAGLMFASGMAKSADQLSDKEKAAIVYRMYAEYKKDFPAVSDITPQEAVALLERDQVVFIDTRKPAEMKVSMLPGAVTEKEFVAQPAKYRDKTPVAYCTISYRSGVFAREMAQQGIPIYNLKGGILAWTLEGGRVVDPSGKPTRRLHVYGDEWDYAPDGYAAVKFTLWERMF
jgi:sodium/bile acid cotransporter 7